MTIHAIDGSTDAATQARIDLAAALRLAVMHELEEGIDNHFTVTLPGHDDRYLVLPFGLHWSEARASDLIVFNEAGETLEGDGLVELSAQCIHAPLHRLSGRQVVLHTHQNWALALNMLEDNRLVPACQTSAFFAGRIAYDDPTRVPPIPWRRASVWLLCWATGKSCFSRITACWLPPTASRAPTACSTCSSACAGHRSAP